MTVVEYQRSRLLPVGLVLIAIGLLVPIPLDMIARAIQSTGTSDSLAQLLSGALLIGSDLVRVLFFAGVACAIIGAIRNRNERKAAERKASGDRNVDE